MTPEGMILVHWAVLAVMSGLVGVLATVVYFYRNRDDDEFYLVLDEEEEDDDDGEEEDNYRQIIGFRPPPKP